MKISLSGSGVAILACFFLLAPMAVGAAGNGACSWHGGVNCSSGSDLDGSVVCADGWRDSSVSFSSVCDSALSLQSTYIRNLEIIDCYEFVGTPPYPLSQFFDKKREYTVRCEAENQKRFDVARYEMDRVGCTDRASCFNRISHIGTLFSDQAVQDVRCHDTAQSQAYDFVRDECTKRRNLASLKKVALTKCPKNSVLDSNLKCYCPFAHYLNDVTNRCEEYPFVGKPKTKNQRDNCAVVAVKAKKVYYLYTSKNFQRLTLPSIECLKDEAVAKKLKYKKLP